MRIEIATRPVHELVADAAVIAQDTRRVFGPARPLELEPDETLRRRIEDALDEIGFGLDVWPLGEVLLSRRPDAPAPWLLEAVVYDLDAEPIVREAIVRQALETCFAKLQALDLREAALSALGTEYGMLQFEVFADLLFDAAVQALVRASSLERLVLALRQPLQVLPLQRALEARLGTRPRILP
jgi:hypothetical protein